MIDYYAILGVIPSATQSQIRTAYREAMRKYHPDLHTNDSNAHTHTQLINEAYAILSNPSDRQNYDREHRKNFPSRPKTYKANVNLTLQETYTGVQKRIRQDSLDLLVELPRGLDTGNVYTLQVEGGVLEIKVHVDDDPRYTRKKCNLYMESHIDVFTAILGGDIIVSIFDKEKVVSVPRGTSSDQQLEVKNLGFPDVKDPSKVGSLFINLILRVPTNLLPDEYNTLAEISRKIRYRQK